MTFGACKQATYQDVAVTCDHFISRMDHDTGEVRVIGVRDSSAVCLMLVGVRAGTRRFMIRMENSDD